jgi:hypothetical protein
MPRFQPGSIYLAVVLGIAGAPPAIAAENWLACDGNVVTSTIKDGKSETTTAAASDFYVYDDARKALYHYSQRRKSLAPVAMIGYDEQAIRWGSPIGLSEGWEGQIDRSSMTLKMVRTEGPEVMTWSQQCKPTSPQSLAADQQKEK